MRAETQNAEATAVKNNDKKILVIGASGFVGKHAVKQLRSDGHAVRCMARNPDKIKDLASIGCEIVQGDISDQQSLNKATAGVRAVYISIQTLVPQNSNTADQGFMDIELNGLQNVINACRANGVGRLIYITFLGVSSTAKSAWIRGRWDAEQLLLNSGLEVTVIRPGMIVGTGGQGFNMLLGNARKRLAFIIGNGNYRFRTIAISDLAFLLAAVLDNHQTYGQCYDVGSNDVLTMNQMIDIAAEILGKRHPAKFHLPTGVLAAFAPVIERIANTPKGAIKGMVDSIESEMVGDPGPINRITGHTLLSFRQSVESALITVS